MGLPTIYMPAGPMLRGNWKGKTLGSGSDAWKYWDERRAGKISDKDWVDVEAGIARSYGTCMTMGTASTMTAIAESIGMTLPASAFPPPISHTVWPRNAAGKKISKWCGGFTPKDPDPQAFENAIRSRCEGCSPRIIL